MKKKQIFAAVLSMALVISLFGDMGFADTKRKQQVKKYDVGEYVSPMGEYTFDGKNRFYSYEDPELLVPSSFSAQSAKSPLPSYFNLAKKGLSTPVRDQGSYGTCWAHAALASMEGSLIKKKLADTSIDLAERHLAWYAYECVENTVDDKSLYAGRDRRDYILEPDVYNRGGLLDTAVFAMARRYGAVDEKDCPYNPKKNAMKPADDVDGCPRTLSKYSLENAFYLPETCKNDISLTGKKFLGYQTASIGVIKKILMEKGPVYTSYHAYNSNQDVTGPFSNDKYNSYYCWDGNLFSNHAVTIVGWDDEFSAKKFNDGNGKLPIGDGAWIIKNSWGTNVGDDGYIYMSYYDKSMMNHSFYDANLSKNVYKNIYQLDGIGVGDGLYRSSSPVEAANTYKSRGQERIRAVGTYTPYANCYTDISIYTGKPGSDDFNSIVEHTQHEKYAGYHTIRLPKNPVLRRGQVFTVSVKTYFYKDGKKTYFMPFETKSKKLPLGWPTTILDVEPQQTSIKIRGVNHGNWCDVTEITDYDEDCIYGNALAKIYTDDYSASPSPTPEKPVNMPNRIVYPRYTYKLKTPGNAPASNFTWSSSNPKVASIAGSGKIKSKTSGIAVIKAKTKNSSDGKVYRYKVTVRPQTPTRFKAYRNKSVVTLNWRAGSDAHGINIYIARKDRRGKYSFRLYRTIKGNKAYKAKVKIRRSSRYKFKLKSYRFIEKVKFLSGQTRTVSL